jgi:hypothetical protein
MLERLRGAAGIAQLADALGRRRVGRIPSPIGVLTMAESEKAKANRLEKAREQRRVKRERTGDTPEAKAERRKPSQEYDADEMKKRVGNPGAALLS